MVTAEVRGTRAEVVAFLYLPDYMRRWSVASLVAYVARVYDGRVTVVIEEEGGR